MRLEDKSYDMSQRTFSIIKPDAMRKGHTTFMSSGPIVALVLEKDNAIGDLRKLMGATNPANAEEGTIRKKYAGSIEENAIHGSDAAETAQFEIGYFFAGHELI